MGFLINCDNKGCGQAQEPFLDLTTDEVICSACQGAIKNITSFTKRQLKSMGQTLKTKKEAGSILCGVCKLQALPKESGSQLLCPKCQNLHQNIPRAYEVVVREMIKQKAKEELEDQVDQNKKARKLPAPKPKALPQKEVIMSSEERASHIAELEEHTEERRPPKSKAPKAPKAPKALKAKEEETKE